MAHHHICGFFYLDPLIDGRRAQQKKYIPQVSLSCHARIVSTVVRTTLTQTFVNPSTTAIPELHYTFPLYDGVSVVGFTCTINKDRVIRGVVKEKQEARQTFNEAVARGETAALLEQVADASDVFSTTVGNVAPNAEIQVDITYLGELKHDAQVDGTRFTLPTSIAPRYGSYPGELVGKETNVSSTQGIKIVVDTEMPSNCAIKSIQSPSHPISVTIGSLSTTTGDAAPSLQLASASLSLGTAELDQDFILHVIATNTSDPVAILETHPTIPSQRALMATLVPKFNLPSSRPEIVFICDRSGSMGGGKKIPNLKSALQLFLKSLPVGVKFNICSFGSSHTYLFPDGSQTYDQSSLDTAMRHVATFGPDYGGTEIARPVEDTFKRRYKDMDLDVFVLTDGEVWNQQGLFDMVNKHVEDSNGAIRLFTLGVGKDVSHALIEGLARAGNGFSQAVSENEKMDSKVVRMLKGALSPHIKDYSLEVKYGKAASELDDDDFEVVEKVLDALNLDVSEPEDQEMSSEAPSADNKQPISLYDRNADLDAEMEDSKDRYSHIPSVAAPKLLQAPFKIPPLFPFNRTSVYLLMSPETAQQSPSSIVLRGTSDHGPLELEIPVTALKTPDSTIHQLATRKAVKELEEGRGWITQAKDKAGVLLKDKYEGHFSDMVEREAVRLGLQFQVAGKWCSFVAVEDGSTSEKEAEARVLGTDQSPRNMVPRFSRILPMAPAPASGAQLFGAPQARARMASGGQPAPMVAALGAAPLGGRAAPTAMFSHPGSSGMDRLATRKKKASNSMGAFGAPMGSFAGRMMKSDDDEGWDETSSPQADPLQRIVMLQTFSGSWTWAEELFDALGIDENSATSKLQSVGPGSSKDVMATILVISFLRKRLPLEKDAWEMLVEKATIWLDGELGTFPTSLAEAADELFV